MSDATAQAHPPHAKEGNASSKTWYAVGITASVMIGVVVLLWIIGALLSPTANGLQQIVVGLKQVNQALFGFKLESNLLIINFVQIVVLPVALFLLIRYWALK